MKKHAFIILSFLLSVVVYAQSSVDNPRIGFSTARNVILTKVSLSDSATVLSFTTKAKSGDWISIPSKTYIREIKGNEKIYIKRTVGIPLGERYTMPASGEVSYKLIFPAISKTAGYIDYGEDNDGGSWFIYDIAVNQLSNKLRVPKDLYGNWFNTSTGDWELSFNDKYAVYKNQVWNYDFPKISKDLKSLLLTTGNGKTTVLYYKTEKSGACMFGESALELKSYSKIGAEAQKNASVDNKPYELPIFKLDSTTYSGYIKGYTPRIGVKTLSFTLDDIITGNQTSHVIKIAENGFFTVKLPFYYPHFCWVGSSIYNGSVFLEPGKELFQMLDFSNPKNPLLNMGESARLNSDLAKLMKINSFDYRAMQRGILDMSPAQYKSFFKSYETKDLNALDSIMRSTKLSAKACQVMKQEIGYRAMSYMMSYNDYFESAYREKNKIPRTQRDLKIKTDSLTAGYFDFISNESVNNPLAVIANSYYSVINRLKYLEILRIGYSFSINTQLLGVELEKSGYIFTNSEKLMLEKLKEVDSISNSAEEKTYNEKYSKQIQAFYANYQDDFKSIYKNTPKADNTVVDKYFKDNNIKLTADEKKIWKIITNHDNSEKIKNIHEFYTAYRDSITAFHNTHMLFMNELFAQKSNENRNKNMKTLFGVQPGLASDVMLAQDFCRNILEELSPVSTKKLQTMQQQIVTPFIADYIAVSNNQAIAKLEGNKKKTGFVVNEVPKTVADNVFNTIMQKYKGKVVYVDFWATWCGPCRSGIAQKNP